MQGCELTAVHYQCPKLSDVSVPTLIPTETPAGVFQLYLYVTESQHIDHKLGLGCNLIQSISTISTLIHISIV